MLSTYVQYVKKIRSDQVVQSLTQTINTESCQHSPSYIASDSCLMLDYVRVINFLLRLLIIITRLLRFDHHSVVDNVLFCSAC